MELPIAPETAVRLLIDDPAAIDDERRQLIEEVGRVLALRLEQLTAAG